MKCKECKVWDMSRDGEDVNGLCEECWGRRNRNDL